MLSRYAPRLAVAVRAGSHHAPAKTAWAPQTPPSHIHDGWASAVSLFIFLGTLRYLLTIKCLIKNRFFTSEYN